MGLLCIKGLWIRLERAGSPAVPLVDEVSFSVEPGETLALVGESGSGKTLSCLALLGLLPAGSRVGGSIRFDGVERVAGGRVVAAGLRGREIGMVFQDPRGHLNPVRTVGSHLVDTLRHHRGGDRRGCEAAAAELLGQLGLPEPSGLLRRYPHELSGGQSQRVMLALALAARPRLLIADEATTALDVMVQAQTLRLLGRLARERHLAVVLVTHDLGIASRQADSVCVLYAGRTVETAPTEAFFRAPRHPYSAALIGSMPSLQRAVAGPALPETMPPPGVRPAGCAFAPRCDRAMARCRTVRPGLADDLSAAVACLSPLAAAAAWARPAPPTRPGAGGGAAERLAAGRS